MIIAEYLAEKTNEEKYHPTYWIISKIRLILQSIGVRGDPVIDRNPKPAGLVFSPVMHISNTAILPPAPLGPPNLLTHPLDSQPSAAK